MSLRIGNYACGTDLLIKLGLDFEPETVVIDANEVLHSGFSYTPGPGIFDFPPFPHCCIEFSDSSFGRAGVHFVAYISRLDAHEAQWVDDDQPFSFQRMYLIIGYGIDRDTILCGNPLIGVNSQHVILCYNASGEIQKVLVSKRSNLDNLPNTIRPVDLARKQYHELADLMLGSFALMHTKTTSIDIVEAPRNQRRRIAAKTGKNPSPYLWVRVGPGVKHREYAHTETGQGGKRREHTVRAHPRTYFGHPFIPDGIYLIPAHTRGGDERVEKKSYRIVME